MLPFESHLERVLAINLGQVIRQLEVELTSSEGRKALLPKVESPLIPNAGSPPFSCP